METTKEAEQFEFGVGLHAVRQHVMTTLGPKLFARMVKKLRPAVKVRALATKSTMSVAAFRWASEPNLPQEERAAIIACAVEWKLREDANGAN